TDDAILPSITTAFTGLRPVDARKTENPPAATPVQRFVIPATNKRRDRHERLFVRYLTRDFILQFRIRNQMPRLIRSVRIGISALQAEFQLRHLHSRCPYVVAAV
ncbi:MAG: hypothetical protein ACK58T_45170, partial [Phycisphaerae bacterium]